MAKTKKEISMELQQSKTYQNLARAYVGETQAYVRYQFVEYGARNQGYNALAEVVDKIVYNEFNHARILYTIIQQSSKEQIDNIQINAGYPFKEKWDLTDNFALAAEDHESEIKMYKSFEKTARAEGFEDIANTFKMLADVEKQHKKTFENLHEQLKNNSLYKKDKAVTWRCSGCGFESTEKEAWEKCPLCNAAQGFVNVKTPLLGK